MIKSALEVISPYYQVGRTLAVTNYENVQAIPGVEVIGADHPLPDIAGLTAASKCAEIAQNAKADELLLVLVSGGGSALIPYPVTSVSLQDKILTTQLLLASGATINEINCVRKHLSCLKGGGLARLTAPADCHALILSDVLGDDVSASASGPTVPDATTYTDAVDILKCKSIWQQIPDAVRAYLQAGMQGNNPETPKAHESFFKKMAYTLIGSNKISLDALTQAAQDHGFETILYTDQLCGEASVQSEKLVAFAKEQISRIHHKPIAIVAGGETTVTLKGHGKGGRNQEVALAFAIHAEYQKLPGNWVFLSGGTDGRDGPTEAAGGIVDSGTIQRIINAGANPANLLAENDSFSALKAAHDLLMTGATGTNVADLQLLLVEN